MSSRRLLLVAGEVSGDIHGANLLPALRVLEKDLEAFGIGGERLQAAGLDCIASSDALAHMGLAEVVRELPRIRRIMGRVVEEVDRRPPRAAVLIDSPDFNLRLAARLRRRGIPVVLYVSPQLWAWRRGRVRVIRRVAREVLCILPFEADFYQAHGVRARYVGHPLVDDVVGEDLLAGGGRTSRRDRLALLPGSRAMEVRGLLPTMMRALNAAAAQEVAEAVLLLAPGMGPVVEEVLAKTDVDPRLTLVSGRERRRRLAGCGMAWAASGTATLECALLDVPMVVGYRLHPLTYALARMLVRVPHVALVNLIAGRALVPELLQGTWQPEELLAATRAMLAGRGDLQREGLEEVRTKLGGPGASARAAAAVARYLE